MIQVSNPEARAWYLKEAQEQMWSYRTLDRNIGSQYYERLLLSHNKGKVENEMKSLTLPYQQDKLEFIKNPTVAEFIGLSPNTDFTESKLESAIIGNLQRFLLELGKGFSYVTRQKLVRTEKKDYYIDLVFYNYLLKCFVLIDLKTNPISHQDVGQMDMYVRMYDELMRSEGDNPTIGIVLCSETDEDIARYSVLHDNNQLFASKYMLYMPTEEELRNEIERQKHFTCCNTRRRASNNNITENGSNLQKLLPSLSYTLFYIGNWIYSFCCNRSPVPGRRQYISVRLPQSASLLP